MRLALALPLVDFYLDREDNRWKLKSLYESAIRL